MNAGYYVTIIRSGRGVRYLTGPFDLPPTPDMITMAARRAEAYDPRAAFDAFGTTRVTSEKPLPQGIFNEPCDRPCATVGLESYRYLGRFGWIMIGATDDADALNEASRSSLDPVTKNNLWHWDEKAGRYRLTTGQ